MSINLRALLGLGFKIRLLDLNERTKNEREKIMGFMTEISILNDAWHEIEEHPDQLVEAIKVGMDGEPGQTHGIQGKRVFYANPITTYPSHHASDPRIYIASQNSFIQLNKFVMERQYSNRLLEQDWLRELLLCEIREAEYQLKEAKKFLKAFDKGKDKLI